MSPGLARAIKRAGSMGKLGRMLGISQQAISQWQQVPARHVIAIERGTGVPREVLRPDLYVHGPKGKPTLPGIQSDALQAIRLARNGYNSAVAAASGYVSGKRIYNLRQEEKRLRNLLWQHRDAIADLIAALDGKPT